MPDGKDITVHVEGLPNMHFPLGTSQDVIQAAVKKQIAAKQPKQPSLGERTWEAANQPLGSRPGGLFAGSKGLPPGGIPEQTRNAIINLISSPSLSDATRRKLFYALDIPAELLTAIPEAGRRMLSPLGIGMMGAGGATQALRELPQVPKAVKAGTALAETGTSVGFGGQGFKEALTPRKKGEALEDYLGRIMSGVGQGLFGTSALAHATAPTAAAGTRKFVREISDRSARDVTKAEVAAKEEARVKQAAHEERLADYQKKVDTARSEHEAKMATKQAEYESEVAAAKAKHQADIGAFEQSVSGSVTRQAHAELKNARLTKAKEQMTASRDQAAKDLVTNLDKTEANEKGQLDDRYKKFDQQILGVTEQNPNGTLQSELSPIAEKVLDARKNILKGSATNIPIFNSILGRIKEMIELPDGSIKPMEGQTIPTAQLRGYVRELGDAIYDHENLPGDVRQAIKAIEEAAKQEVAKSIKDVHGQSATKLYEDLSADWANYKRVWFDRSRVNPLANMRRIFRDPSVERSGLSVSDQIAKQVSGEKGRNVVKLLAEKARYGGDPRAAAKLMSLDAGLDKIESQFERVPVAKYPRFPKGKEIAKPVVEPFKVKTEPPEAPKTEPFNRQEFIKEGIEKKMQRMGNIGSGLGAFWALKDLISGEPVPAMRMAEAVALMQALKYGVTNPRVLAWLAREPSMAAQTPTARPAGPQTPERPDVQFKGGISAAGTEQAMRRGTVGEQINSIYAETSDLRERAKNASGPGLQLILARIMENEQMIRELQGGTP